MGTDGGVRRQPDPLAVESIFYGKNVRTTVVLGQARGVILLAGARAGLEIAEFPPAQVKQSIVGAGGAVKAQVAFMVQQLLELGLGLDTLRHDVQIQGSSERDNGVDDRRIGRHLRL